MTRECTCEKCVDACKNCSGVFAPGEAEKAAEYLKIPFEEFKEMLVLNYHRDRYEDPMFWQPRKVGWDHLVDDEGVTSDAWTGVRGACVFLKDDRCSIHAVKPYECRESLLCEKQIHVWDEEHLGKYKK